MRLVSWNILACRGWRPGEHPDTAPGPARPWVASAIAERLAGFAADVIALQECPDEDRVRGMADQLGMQAVWFAARWGGNERWPGGFPGAVLTRLPLLARCDEVAARPDLDADCFQRHWGSVTLTTADGPLCLHAYHCCANWGGQHHDAVRHRELAAVLAACATVTPTVLVGDHNALPGAPCLAQLAAAGFEDAHALAGQGDGATDPAVGPYQRIDQCWVRGVTLRACWVGTGADLGDDPDAVALSDHRPLVVDLEPRRLV